MTPTLPPTHRGGKPASLAALAVVAACLAGCDRPASGFEKYVPPPALAREALAAVLDAWRDGRPPDDGVGPRRDVHVVDKQRKAGQRLARYEILGEVAVENARAFAVRLELQEPGARETVRFVVVGEAPLWVWRQEDFEMISHWMHPMDDPAETPQAQAPRP